MLSGVLVVFIYYLSMAFTLNYENGVWRRKLLGFLIFNNGEISELKCKGLSTYENNKEFLRKSYCFILNLSQC